MGGISDSCDVIKGTQLLPQTVFSVPFSLNFNFRVKRGNLENCSLISTAKTLSAGPPLAKFFRGP